MERLHKEVEAGTGDWEEYRDTVKCTEMGLGKPKLTWN